MALMFLKADSYKLKPNSGFTLIELLVVIAIIGLLSSIVLASLGAARNKAADAAIQADLVGVRSQAEIYYADNGESYSSVNTGLLITDSCSTYNVSPTVLFSNSSIKNAIVHAFQQNGLMVNGLYCAADNATKSYAVAVALKTSPTGAFKNYFCVDSTGIAKTKNNIMDPFNDMYNPPWRCL